MQCGTHCNLGYPKGYRESLSKKKWRTPLHASNYLRVLRVPLQMSGILVLLDLSRCYLPTATATGPSTIPKCSHAYRITPMH